jgi:Skp family chaperone for outer membrane proteins
MKVLKTVTVIAALGFVLSAGAAAAQTAPPAQPPATQPPVTPPPGTQPPGTQPPTTQKPVDPATQKPAEPKPRPPVPFPEGAKVAYIDYQYVASNADEGKAATTKIQALQKKKNEELTEKNKALQAQQGKLQTSGNLMNDQARAQLEREIEKAQRELQFLQQDATDDINALTQQLQQEFGLKIAPIVEAIANEKGLHMVLAAPANIAWANPGLDISEDVVKRLNTKTPTPPKK